jgi:hypothetical protein
MNTTQIKRIDILARIHKTLDSLKNDGYDLDDKKLIENLILQVMKEYGTTRRTAREYLDAVKDIKFSKIEEGFILQP